MKRKENQNFFKNNHLEKPNRLKKKQQQNNHQQTKKQDAGFILLLHPPLYGVLTAYIHFFNCIIRHYNG